ncbi:hypothetical protein [Thermus antranikianii]|uniref:hypothetical protein n=1 Tax=Thermus antranikianii TaxID=88190 RepID=UPI001C78940B|nr:hypothetical protein [Thermus antranikianii]QWK20801.1 MAG: hypothetical protein KNN15_06925 [Thermus antranikianii]
MRPLDHPGGAGVDGDGRRSNCGRTNKEGIDWIKAQTPGYERYIALYQTPRNTEGVRDAASLRFARGTARGRAWTGTSETGANSASFGTPLWSTRKSA